MKRKDLGLFLALLGLALFVRLNGLWQYPLWYDEILSIYLAHIDTDRKFFGFIHVSYDAIIQIWGYVFGYQDLVFKISALLPGVLSLIVLWRLLLRYDRIWAHGAAFMMSLSIFHIYYSREARPYALIILLSLFLLYLFLKEGLVREPRRLSFLLLLFGMTFQMYCHPIGVFPVIIFSLSVFLTRWSIRWKGCFVAASAGLLIVYHAIWRLEFGIPGGGTLATLMRHGQKGLAIPEMCLIVFKSLSYGGDTPYNSGLGFEMDNAGFGSKDLLLLLHSFLFLIGIFAMISKRTDIPQHFKLSLVLWLLLPPVSIIGYSFLYSSVFVPRYFTILLPPFFIVTSYGLAQCCFRNVVAFLLILCLFVGISWSPLKKLYDLGTVFSWRSPSDFIKEHNASGLPVVFSPSGQLVAYFHYRAPELLYGKNRKIGVEWVNQMTRNEGALLTSYDPDRGSFCSSFSARWFFDYCLGSAIKELWFVVQKDWPSNSTWPDLKDILLSSDGNLEEMQRYELAGIQIFRYRPPY